MDPTTLKRLLDPMVRRRLVEVRPPTTMPVRGRVFVTQAGHGVLEAAIPHWQAAIGTVTRLIGPAATSALVGSLVKTLKSLTPRQ
jgi:hypothetical protein